MIDITPNLSLKIISMTPDYPRQSSDPCASPQQPGARGPEYFAVHSIITRVPDQRVQQDSQGWQLLLVSP